MGNPFSFVMSCDLIPDKNGFPKTPGSPKTPKYQSLPRSPRSPGSPKTPILRISRFLERPGSPRTPGSSRTPISRTFGSPRRLIEIFNERGWLGIKLSKQNHC